METVIGLVKSLASVQTSNSRDIDFLANTYGTTILKRLCSAMDGLHTVDGADIVSRAPIYMKEMRSRCWCPEFGRTNSILRRGDASTSLAALQFALGLIANGFEGEISADLSYPDRLFVGTFWFPCAKATTISAKKGIITVSSGIETYSIRIDASESFDGSSSVRCQNASMEFLWGYSVDEAILEPADATLLPGNVRSACASLEEALNIVKEAGAIYIQWVERLVRQVTIVESDQGGRLSSRSSALRPANIEMAAPGNALHLAELFVHEAAHQHFHLGALLGSYIKPDHEETIVYSALKGTKRPLERMLLAFHAIGNIYLFLDELVKASGVHKDDAIERMHELGPVAHSLLRELEDHLSHLSETGQTITEDLISETRRLLKAHEISETKPQGPLVMGVQG